MLRWIAIAGLALVVCPVQADEPLFGYTFTTDLLPKGRLELAQSVTWRTGKAVGEFDVLEGRTEIEYGLNDRFQVAAYLNYEWAHAYLDNVINGSTLPPATLANLDIDPNGPLNTLRFTGLSVEGIYRILSPYTDPIGLAVYLKPSVGPQLRELESRLIVQKNFLDDRMVVAANVTLTEDWRYIPSKPGKIDSNAFDRPWDEQSGVSLGVGISYRFAVNWSLAIEVQNERGFVGNNPLASGSKTNVAYYLGPGIHYADRHLFVTATFLDQLPYASDYAHTNPDFVVDGRSYAANFERHRLRVKFGWYF